jgi:O-antigen/teichoic acid export membrane protein
VAAILGLVLIPSFGATGGALSFTAAELVLFGALIRRARVHAEVEVARPLGSALLACAPMVLFLWFGRFSLPVTILAGALLFAAASAAILRRGTEAGGLA